MYFKKKITEKSKTKIYRHIKQNNLRLGFQFLLSLQVQLHPKRFFRSSTDCVYQVHLRFVLLNHQFYCIYNYILHSFINAWLTRQPISFAVIRSSCHLPSCLPHAILWKLFTVPFNAVREAEMLHSSLNTQF